jgi:hypothetical protein
MLREQPQGWTAQKIPLSSQSMGELAPAYQRPFSF